MMQGFLKKLNSKKGETLIESLIAILIFTCASLVMYAMVSSAGNINEKAKEMDSAYQDQLLIAERGEGAGTPGQVSVTLDMGDNGQQPLVTIDVDIYGGTDDSLYAYYEHVEEGGAG